MGNKEWSRFSLRLLIVIVTVATAYSGGRSSMTRRAYIAETDAAHSRERAAELESELRLARAALATVEVRPLPITLAASTHTLPHTRWAISTNSVALDGHAAMLDQLGIKLVVPTPDGQHVQIISAFTSNVSVVIQNEVPSGYMALEATQQDHMLLVRSGVPSAATGIAKLIPPTLADALAQAEAEFLSKKGLNIGDIHQTHFSVSLPTRQPRPVVIGYKLLAGKNSLPVQSAFNNVPVLLPPGSSAPSLK